MTEQNDNEMPVAGVVEGAGVALSYRERGRGTPRERGRGTPLVLLHDMGQDARSLRALQDALAPTARVICFDRRGYGASGAPAPYESTTVYEQAQDAAALLHALDAVPAIVFGEGFGALIALDLLVRHPRLVRAAALAEPPLFAFVPSATVALAHERELLSEALREGGPAHAVQCWRALRGPDAARDAARVVRAEGAANAFFADFAGLASWPVTRAALRAIAVPVCVITGPGTAPHVRLAADELAELVRFAAPRRRDGDAPAALSALLSEAVDSAGKP